MSPLDFPLEFVPRVRIELTTRGFSVRNNHLEKQGVELPLWPVCGFVGFSARNGGVTC